MKLGRKILRHENGASTIEAAIALPILASTVYGIFQLALLFFANAGMQWALGEGARFATLYATGRNVTVTTTSGSPAVTTTSTRTVNYATAADVQSKINSELFGPTDGTFVVDMPVSGTTSTTTTGLSEWYDLRVTYTRPMNFLLFAGPTITLVRTKRVYLAVS
ncbi:pilus assembly protein [Sphingomonas piscis]|uniref:Pilus assembly protein n=1 Tax=Sphingomonas piscis TaxID=2714943 RepID=A0A6G7YS04_9SPHN|nr:TadE/TadG family type IV pilus assembly protein [Sphingomonas piscis]QIK79528.1 pilus assembly protein [Sphingomonas piscis]